jgi:mono/diheme cytochrome c family protein
VTLLAVSAFSGGISAQSARSAAPTFTKDVAPIFYKSCVSCHRPGDIAPMSLLTYEDARPYVTSIRSKVSSGTMPPWHAEAPVGTFKNDRRLSQQDKDTILAWASNGAPQGNPADLPSAPSFTAGWSIGKPDVVLTMSKSFDVPAAGEIPYQYFELPTNFTEDKWVQAIELRPGA